MTDARAALAAITARADAATPGPWEVRPHSHLAAGCKCLSCDDEPTGWSVENTASEDCEDVAARRNATGGNDFGRPFTACDAAVLPHGDAAFIAAARDDLPRVVAAVEAVLDLPQRPWDQRYADDVEARVARAYNSALADALYAIATALGADR